MLTDIFNPSPTVPRRGSVATAEGGGGVQEFDDGRSFDPVAVHQSTQRWITMNMKKRCYIARDA
jgi:hypothetical protein